MRYSDDKLKILISVTLRSGVLAASALGLLGGILFFASHPQLADFRNFQGTAAPFVSPGQILRQAFGNQNESLQLRGLSIVQLGILLLLMTPVIRVVFSIYGFAMEKDRAYVVITCIVLLTLTVSICLH
jgi:uncharacterized membrane protein